MEVPAAGLAVLLLTAALCSQTSSSFFGADTPTSCCFFYISRQIPRKFVVDYYETSSQCSKPGVIFQTKRGRQICAHPREAWVQEYISDLELNASGLEATRKVLHLCEDWHLSRAMTLELWRAPPL